MLQQTRAQVVVEFFERWMAALPTLEDLARAEEERVLSLWQGLGYYSRARRLREGARYVVSRFGGRLPRDVGELSSIPGVGRYTAGAIASQAYGERAPIVDGNVQRVLTRVFGLEGLATKEPVASLLWELSGRFVEAGEPSIVNQSLMELGALVCTPKKPSCPSCPWSKACVGLRSGAPESFPRLPARAKALPVELVVFVVRAGDSFLVERLPRTARWWAGLHTFPLLELGDGTNGAISGLLGGVRTSARPDEKAPVDPRDIEAWGGILRTATGWTRAPSPVPLAPRAHQVTRFRLALRPVLVTLPGRRPPSPPGAEWVPRAELVARSWPGPLGRLARELAED